MAWTDRIVGEIEQRFAEKIAAKKLLVIRDEKTLSGRVHVGSLRGIAIHGLIAQVLNERGIANVFRFELNDFDPMDEIPRTLERTAYEKYMGQPLFTVPPHEPSAETYPLVFGNELQGVLKHLGFTIDWYRLQPEYMAGKFNGVIGDALDHAKEIRAIYREVSGSVKPDDWYPLQVICEKCGKVGTTQVTAWNSTTKTVTYHCKENLVKWAKGCGNSGTVSPFDGHAKLPWKVEWPAKWKVFGVDIEGAGKDHSAAGGSREIGKRIVEEVFHYPNPFDIPYEFFNIGGKKMSASKGLGASAKEISDLLPPTQLRLLMIRKQPNQPIDFDPEGTTIPTLFDEYDRLADHYFKRHPKPEEDFARTYALCQKAFPEKPKDVWHMRFSLAAFLVQMPHLNATEEAQNLKGSPLTEDDLADMNERLTYARRWIEGYAPEKYQFRLAS
ncbi:MAG: lysine--tRNA ligase, partial [Candidatus Peribacteraceae bacterium]|nr:lysine--tRNA ligase [Candidatus Peribacteraceae bacterium]